MNGFTLVKSKIKTWIISFKQSLLFYPVIFSIGSLILFLITARIDELLYGSIVLNVPYLDSLIFAGSPNAARSILSTIAAGWATILGVAFSVTLITLQLATTRYTSHIVSRFENDKINQLMLGWFMSVVVYSLLVLKTVRTGEDTGVTFTPIVGVNIAVLVAIVALFIFVLFLHNISSYLRPNNLASRLTDQIICSTKPYEKRKPSKNILLDGSLSSEIGKKYQIKSKMKGVLRHIDWKIISNSLQDLAQSNDTKTLRMEWSKSLGDWIEKDSAIATIYGIDNNNDDNNNGNPNNNRNNDFDQKILSAIDIAKDRDILTDPAYGIEVLRSLAVKSIDQFDTDVVNSCITGLFRVLNDVFKSKEKIGVAFDLSNDDIRKKNNPGNKKTILITGRTAITVNPKESKLSDASMTELSLIYKMVKSKRQESIIKHFAEEYVSLSKDLLDKTKTDAFERLTGWYNTCILKTSFRKDLHNQILPILVDFKEEISKNYPNATDIFAIHMKDILTGKFENGDNNSQANS